MGAFAVLVLAVPTHVAAASAAGGLKVAVDTKGKRVTASVRPASKPLELSVRLNGKKVTGLFEHRPAGAGPVVLGRGDGLRHGRNKLRVRALLSDGRDASRTLRFRIKDRRPLADAGAAQRIFGGDPIDLSAAKSKVPGKGRPRYRWKVITSPPGSKPKLRRARSAKPKLITEAAGVYQVRVQVRSGRGPTSADVVQIDATDPNLTRAGIFVSTAPFGPGAADGPATSLKIFGGSEDGTYPIGQGSPGPVVTFFFDRATMALLTDGPVYTGAGDADAAKLEGLFDSAVQTTGRTPLVVSAGNNYGQTSDEFNGWLVDYLNAKDLVGKTAPTSFALAGVGTGLPLVPPNTTPPASMHFVKNDTYGSGRLSGQILPDASQNWAFVPSGQPAFGTPSVRLDTDDSGAIELAGNSYPAADPPGGCPNAGGFQVLAVGAAPPDLLTPIDAQVTVDGRTFSNGDTFWTAACANGPNSADEESRYQEEAMLGILNEVPIGNSNPPALVFIQSVGNVAPSLTTADPNQQFDIAIMDIADRITALGGSAGTFLSLFGSGTTGYGFIGQNFTNYGTGRIVSRAEVATNMPTTPPARLIGSMRFDPAGRLIPSTVSAGEGSRATAFKSGLPQSELAKTMNAGTWERTPFPNEGNPAWQAALQDLATAAGLTYDPDDVPCYRPPGGESDVRSNYCGGVPEGENPDTYWKNVILPEIQGATFVAGRGYTRDQFAQVQAQLAIELPLVDDANEAANDLAQVFTATQAADANDIATVFGDELAKAKRQAQLEATPTDVGWIGEIFDLAASVTGFITDEASGVLWVVSASLNNASDLATDGSGDPVETGLDGVIAAENLASSVESQITNQVDIANELRFALADTIVSDWGRLQEADGELANVPKTEEVADSADQIRFGGIRYVWNDLLQSTATLNNIDNSSINIYSPSGQGIQPGYDFNFSKNYGCWLSGTGIFKDGESIEKVYGDVTAGSVYSDPHNLFAWQQWQAYSPYVLTFSGVNPSGSGSSPPPSPAQQYYASFLPDALVDPFSAAQPLPGTSLDAVTDGGPPGLGYDRDQLFDRLFLTSGDNVTCHGPPDQG